MTLEPNVIARRLQSLRETVKRLEPLASTPRAEFIAEVRTHWAAERGIQLAAEAVLDIASHILAGHFDRFPETNEQSLDALLETGVLAPETRNRLRGFGGFRNILVHNYLDLDLGQVYDHLQQLPADLDTFIHDITGWLADIDDIAS